MIDVDCTPGREPRSIAASRSVCWFVCLFVCLCRVFSAVFDPIVLIFGYIVERTNTKIVSSHFFAISILNPNYDVINDVISGFAICKSCRRAMRFSPLHNSEDFMGRGGLRFLYLL